MNCNCHEIMEQSLKIHLHVHFYQTETHANIALDFLGCTTLVQQYIQQIILTTYKILSLKSLY